MSENKDNPPINLELLERQLREALARRPSESAQERSGVHHAQDPLAELSRLSGFETHQPADQQAPSPSYRSAEHAQQDLSDHYELQAVGDRFGVPPQFSPPPQTPITVAPPQVPVSNSASYSSGIGLNSPLFQSISVNYGGFQNSPVVPPTPQPEPAPPQAYQNFDAVLSPAQQHGAGQGHDAQTGQGHGLHSVEPHGFAVKPIPVAPSDHPVSLQQSPSAPVPDFAANPYEKIENSYNPQAPAPQAAVTDSVFESRIFSTLRPPVHEPVAPSMTSPVQETATQHEHPWPAQPEQRSPLSMSESEAHDDLFHQAQQVNKSGSGGKGAYILLGLLALLGGGFGLAAYLRTEGATVPSGPAPIIAADKTPVKVPPADQGSSANSVQSSAIYQPGKMDDPKEAKIVSSEEKPVDINTVPRPAGAPLLGEPKKIRTVTIRPDGTVVEENVTNAGTSATNVAAVPRPGAMLAPMPAVPAQPVAVAMPPQVAGQSSPPPAQPQPSTASAPQGPVVRVLPPERPASITTPANPVSAPQPAAEKPVAASPSAEKIEAGSGDYGVQFGAPASEAEARTMITTLKKNNAKIFDGLSFVVQKADNNGRTIFRVRVIGLAREGAISLCEKMKSSGSSCFVAKN